MGDGWVLLVDGTLVSRVPPTSSALPAVPWLRGTPGCLQQQRALSPHGDSDAAQRSRLCQPKGSWGKRIHAWGRGGETDDFIFFKGDSQFVQSLNNASF